MSVPRGEKEESIVKEAFGSIQSFVDVTEKEWTVEEEKALRNKLDWRLLPLATVLYLLCFLDRSNIGNARIQGMEADLKLVGFKFNWALTIFYIPYLLIEIPSNILLKRIGPKVYLPSLVVTFGFVSLCTAFVKDFTGLAIVRAALGLAEGGTMPGIAFFLSCFYRRHELLFRIGIFVSASSMAGAFGGLLSTALSRIPPWGTESMRIHTWRNIFFFEGLATMLIAGIGYFWMPASPENCYFLNPREQWVASERIRREHKELAKEKTELWHVKKSLLNINNILCAFGFFMINVTVQSFSLFLPTILKALGWTSTRAQLLTVPPYAVACFFSIGVAYLSDFHRKRGIYIFFGTCLVIIGYAILISTDSPNLKYMAVFFAAMGAFPLGPAFLSWGLNNAAGPSIRAISGGYIVAIGTCGAILATWTYIPTDAPEYKKGHSINLAAESIAAVLSLVIIAYVRRENRLRDAGKRDHRLGGLGDAERGKLGYLHPEFRYME